MTDLLDPFDWDDVAENIVQQDVNRVAVYTNPNGDLCIRCEAGWYDNEDVWIVIARGNVPALLAKVREVMDGDEQPLSPAERARRYRNRKKAERDGERDGRDVPPLFKVMK